MQLAIIHEWLNIYGGSERLLSEILDMYPQADVHALIYNKNNLQGTPLQGLKVRTSFLQHIPYVEQLYRGLLPLMPLAIETINVRGYPVVLSISHAVSHGIKTTKDQIHISYVCTPMRYAWHLRQEYLHLHHLDKPILGTVARLILKQLRNWDRKAASRANHVLAISQWTAARIRQSWGRDSRVIYPPVDVKRFSPIEDRDNFYLLVTRLVPYKMTSEIIRVFNQIKLPLIIVGDGPEMMRLKKIANENINLIGYQPDSIVNDLMNRAKAFVYMAVEDFGMAMVEAQAAGCPVIAYAQGGASEIIRNGDTGFLFQEQSAESMMEAVLQFQNKTINNKAAQENAVRFSSERFREEFLAYIDSVVDPSL